MVNAIYSSREGQSFLETESQEQSHCVRCTALSVLDADASPCSFEAAKRAKGLGFASAVSGTLVLTNTVLGGSGLLGMPAAVAKAGYAFGLLLMVTCPKTATHPVEGVIYNSF
eukprot:g16565.t1